MKVATKTDSADNSEELTVKIGKRGGVLNDFKAHHVMDMMPREKLLALGADQLETYELLAILIQTGLQGRPVTQVAADLLTSYNGNLMRMAECSTKEMCEIGGLGPAKAVTIKAALELGYRRQKQAKLDTKIGNSKDVYDCFFNDVAGLSHEEFWIGVLNTANRLSHKKMLFKGGNNKTVVDVREVIKTVLMYDGTAFVVVHNHPSGSCVPSRQDEDLTKRINEAAKLMGIALQDHVIVAQGSDYYSFRDMGKL